MSTVNKATYNDKWRILSREIGSNGYLTDFDDSFVYFESYEYEDGKYEEYKAPYTAEGNNFKVDLEAKVDVVKETVYLDKTSLSNLITSAVEKYFGGSEKKEHIIKMYNDEEMVVVEPLYIAYGEVDAHGHTYKNKAAVYSLVDAFNKAIEQKTLKTSLFHYHDTSVFTPIKAYVNEVEGKLGDHTIKALQPLVEVQFNTKEAFELRKSLELLGVSIGAKAILSEDLEEVEKSLVSKAADDQIVGYLSDFSFDWEGAHLAYTDISQGGAASRKNFYFLAKSFKEYHLTDEQKRILELVGEEFKPLDKSKLSAPSSVGEDLAGEDKILNENGNSNTMSEREKELEKQVQELQKSLKTQEVSKELKSYGFSDEVLAAVSKTVAELSDETKQSLIKAFDALKEVADKNKEEFETLRKASADKEPDLAKEVGAKEDPMTEQEEKLTLKQRVQKARQVDSKETK